MQTQGEPSSTEIVDLQAWLAGPAGAAVAAWERAQFNEQVADVFGYHAVQLGLPSIEALAQNRMPSRWLALQTAQASGAQCSGAQLACDFTALPFDDASVDLLVLPHTLEWCGEATACLREVERVLRPEGHLIVTGFNPASAWALRQHLSRARRLVKSEARLFMPEGGEFIALRRLRDWLRLLSFEVETARFGLHGLPLAQDAVGPDEEAESAEPGPLDRVGQRLWPGLGAVYLVHAVKRVPGMRMMRAVRRQPVFSTAPVQVARKESPGASKEQI